MNKTWLDRVIAEVQDLSLSVITEEQHALPLIVREFTERLEPAPDALHNALLATLMLDFCRHTFDSLHASLSVEQCSCAAHGWSLVSRFTRWYQTDPRTAVCQWTESFFRTYSNNHPPTVSTRAAAMMRLDPARHWTIGAIARALGVTRRHLSTEFRSRFGLGPLDYLHLARISSVMSAIDEPTKVEVLALNLGYRSKKDFYRAFRTWTGTTPAGARSLAHDARRLLKASLRARCLWGDYLHTQDRQRSLPRNGLAGALETSMEPPLGVVAFGRAAG